MRHGESRFNTFYNDNLKELKKKYMDKDVALQKLEELISAKAKEEDLIDAVLT